MSDRIPIIFIHEGNHEYFRAAVLQARKYSEDVVSLNMDINTDLWHEFVKYYVHLSTNSKKIELFCFRRYFIVYQYLIDNSIKNAILLDSDVLVFEDLSVMARRLISGGVSGALCMPNMQDEMRMGYSAHTSVWTVDSLLDFCMYCINTYKDGKEELLKKWDFHLENSQNGGVCDMTLLYLWASKRRGIFNLLNIEDGMAIDHNLNSSENYELEEFNMRYDLKRMKFIKGRPIGFHNDGSKIPFRTLHFQGRSKIYMSYLYMHGSIRTWLCIKRYVRRRFSIFLEVTREKIHFK